MPVLTILHTNDIHARFDQMTRLATLIQRERAQAAAEGRAVLLLDAGDSSSTEEWESDVTGGRANYAMLEAMGYDAAVVGNSDSQWGRDALNRLLAAVHFAPLAANLRDAASDQPPTGLRAYTVLKLDTVNVGVIGLTTYEELHADFRVDDQAETLRALIPQLQSEGTQIVIVLSHLGIEADRRLAANVPGIHTFVGGHSHTTLHEPERVEDASIVQTGEYGQNLGRLDLACDDSARSVTVVGCHLIPCDDRTPPDPTLAGMLELVRFEANVVRKKRPAVK